jgi:hypothetical protein
LKRGAVRLRRGVNWRELDRSRLPRHGHATRCREVGDSLALEAHEPRRVVSLEQPTRVAIRLRNRIHDLPMPCRRSRTPVNASINVEVSVGASDRFECKIAAMINGLLIAEIAVLVGERARATMVWVLHTYILLGVRRATRPSTHAPRRLATV